MQTEMFALFFHPSFCHNKASITRTRRTTMELFTVQQIKSLNELEMLVYQYTIEHPSTVPYMRIRELAA